MRRLSKLSRTIFYCLLHASCFHYHPPASSPLVCPSVLSRPSSTSPTCCRWRTACGCTGTTGSGGVRSPGRAAKTVTNQSRPSPSSAKRMTARTRHVPGTPRAFL
eukprot:5147368-Pleurochrysis_carterae.AAC.5